MSISIRDPTNDFSYQTDSPFCLSVYILDSLKQGTLFDNNTYKHNTITNWLSNFLEIVTASVPMPKTFERTRIQEIFWERMAKALEENDLQKALKSVDPNDKETIKNLVEKNKEHGQEIVEALEQSLRQSDFPSYLWMEYSRYHKAFAQTSDFFEQLILKVSHFKPKRTSQISEKNKQTRTLYHVYFELIDKYFKAITAYLRIGLFLEIWSCNEESTLFTNQCKWNFQKVDPRLFENLFMEFHSSVNDLRSTFFRFKPQEARIDLTKPTDWAFKQLIVMT